MGSGCYAVGIVVVSNTRDLRFKSNHCQKNYLLSTVPIEKTKIKKKEAGRGPIKVVVSVSGRSYKHSAIVGCVCGSVDREVASDTRDPRV